MIYLVETYGPDFPSTTNKIVILKKKLQARAKGTLKFNLKVKINITTADSQIS